MLTNSPPVITVTILQLVIYYSGNEWVISVLVLSGGGGGGGRSLTRRPWTHPASTAATPHRAFCHVLTEGKDTA